MLRSELVKRKMALIAEDLEHLLAFQNDTLESLRADFMRMATVERLLERIVMRAIDINEHTISTLASGTEPITTRLTYRDTFLRMADLQVYPIEFASRIALSAGLRNILVHDYNDLDRSTVHASIQNCLRDYSEYLGYLESFLQNRPS